MASVHDLTTNVRSCRIRTTLSPRPPASRRTVRLTLLPISLLQTSVQVRPNPAQPNRPPFTQPNQPNARPEQPAFTSPSNQPANRPANHPANQPAANERPGTANPAQPNRPPSTPANQPESLQPNNRPEAIIHSAAIRNDRSPSDHRPPTAPPEQSSRHEISRTTALGQIFPPVGHAKSTGAKQPARRRVTPPTAPTNNRPNQPSNLSDAARPQNESYREPTVRAVTARLRHHRISVSKPIVLHPANRSRTAINPLRGRKRSADRRRQQQRTPPPVATKPAAAASAAATKSSDACGEKAGRGTAEEGTAEASRPR